MEPSIRQRRGQQKQPIRVTYREDMPVEAAHSRSQPYGALVPTGTPAEEDDPIPRLRSNTPANPTSARPADSDNCDDSDDEGADEEYRVPFEVIEKRMKAALIYDPDKVGLAQYFFTFIALGFIALFLIDSLYLAAYGTHLPVVAQLLSWIAQTSRP